jgi:hypothetical protein
MMHIRNGSIAATKTSPVQQQQTSPPNPVDNLSINDSGQLRYYGISSGFDTLTTNAKLKTGWIQFSNNHNSPSDNDKKRRLIAIDPFELPPDDLSQHLLDLYFTTFYPWLPLIHKDAFLTKMTNNNDESNRRPPSLLLNAIYAVASRVSNDLRVRTIPDQADTAGDLFFERARLLLDLEWDNFNVYTVQSLLLMSSHQNGALRTVRGWIYSGMAFRMAQNLGLHRNCDNWALSEVEKEERKRCFYCCLIVDRIASTMYGRSPVLDERDYDTLYPSYHDKDGATTIERFHQLIKLCELLGEVLRDLYMVRGRKQLAMMTCPDSVVAKLDRGLNQWMAKLPASMQYRPPNTRVNEQAAQPPALQLCQLHMLFYTILILLHRPFIPGAPSSSTSPASASFSSVFPSASICTFAANKILDISESLLAANLLDKVNNYALYFLFTAGVIFIHNAQQQQQQQQDEDGMFAFEAKISINKIMRAMDVLEKTWSTSARHCNILGALAGLRDIDLQNVDESYSRQAAATISQLSIAVPNSPHQQQDEDATTATSSTSPKPLFHPDASAFWEIPSSFDIQEWNSYLTDQAQKIDPMMMPPTIQDP